MSFNLVQEEVRQIHQRTGFFVLANRVRNKGTTVSILQSSLYLVFGIALLAMNFNLIQEEVINNNKSAAKRLGIVKNDEENEENCKFIHELISLCLQIAYTTRMLQLALCSLYLLFGIVLLAMSFNLVQEEVINNIKSVAKRLGIVKDDEEDED
ncbi:hypothetical protein ANN_26597 [Periplaneta americana]|uniref:Uncharacterized protein n=1 Tax=Periplaneta americana TaxID=6978 RepID=A0ABQ8RYP1_PERAM|nr:hypothetical protein ANN_26597 [Periplaneta americana]